MRLLFELDLKNYDETGRRFIRPSVRGIIIRHDKVAMIHSFKYHYYKFPGGGIETGEDMVQALTREVREEAGLIVVPESIVEFGRVRRVEREENNDIFEQDNFYFFCSTEPEPVCQQLDDYEAEEGFALEYVAPEYAVKINRTFHHGPKSLAMLERESRVLEICMAEHRFEKTHRSARRQP